MGLKRCEAIVLRSQKLGEYDKIITLLSREDGKLRGVAKGARKLKQRFGASLEPMSHVKIEYFEKGTAELVRIESTELLRSYFGAMSRPEAAGVLAAICELVDGFAQERQANEKLFRLVSAVAECVAHADSVALMIYIEVWLLRLAGLFPPVTRCIKCGREMGEREPLFIVTELGGLECERCAVRQVRSFDARDRALMQAALRQAPPEFLATASGCEQRSLAHVHEYLKAAIQHALGRRVKAYTMLDPNDR